MILKKIQICLLLTLVSGSAYAADQGKRPMEIDFGNLPGLFEQECQLLPMTDEEEKAEADKKLTAVQMEEMTQDFWKAIINNKPARAYDLLEQGLDSSRVIKNHAWRCPVLVAAADSGRNEIVKMLIGKKSDVNLAGDRGMSALICAALRGHDAIVKSLLEAQAHVNHAAGDGITALHFAAQNGYNSCVQLLLDGRAEVGESALFAAAQTNQHECMQTLIRAKADVNQRSRNFETALYVASSQGHRECVKELIEGRADVSLAKADGFTPLLAAVLVNNTDIVQLLLAFQADPIIKKTVLINDSIEESRAIDYAQSVDMSAILKGKVAPYYTKVAADSCQKLVGGSLHRYINHREAGTKRTAGSGSAGFAPMEEGNGNGSQKTALTSLNSLPPRITGNKHARDEEEQESEPSSKRARTDDSKDGKDQS